MRLNKIMKTVCAAIFMLALTFNAQAQDKNIVELAAGNEDLSTLVTAVKAGDLVETLQSDGPFTVFAPTNAAFEALPEGVLEMLLKPENKDKLVAVLTYHVVPAEVMSSDLEDGMMAKTVQGAEATISLEMGKAMVDNATVVAADVNASNGVVHVIDSVILPPSIKKALASNDDSGYGDSDKGDW